MIGTDVSLQTIYQSTPTSAINTVDFKTVEVIDPGIEFISIKAIEAEGASPNLADVAINIGSDFIEIDFNNTGPYFTFTSAYQNGYVLTFNSNVPVYLLSASIDANATNFGLISNDLILSNDQLIINVEGLSFSRSSFARINLEPSVEPSPVPLPGAFWLFGMAISVLAH